MRNRLGWSLSNLVALLRLSLFVHRYLRAWIDQPFTPPPDTLDGAYQPELAFASFERHAAVKKQPKVQFLRKSLLRLTQSHDIKPYGPNPIDFERR